MRVLFDQGTPVPLRRLLPGHEVATAYEMGWASLSNGELLAAAETEGFAAIVTTDKNLRHQQSLAGRALGVLVLPTTKWRDIQRNASRIADALLGLRAGSIDDVTFRA